MTWVYLATFAVAFVLGLACGLELARRVALRDMLRTLAATRKLRANIQRTHDQHRRALHHHMRVVPQLHEMAFALNKVNAPCDCDMCREYRAGGKLPTLEAVRNTLGPAIADEWRAEVGP